MKKNNIFIDFINIFKSLKEDMKMFLKKDPTANSGWFVFFTSIAYHALISYRFANFFNKHRMKFFGYFIYTFSKIFHHVDIHPSADLEAGIVIDHGFGIVIGETAKVGSGTLIYHGVTLGAKNVTNGKRHPDVGKNVMIGAGAKVLGPIIIGDDSVIGSNSVVLMDIPPKSVAVGIPAKIKKFNCPSYNFIDIDKKINNDFVI
jgi:serine O-acetyltransferase